MNRKVLQIEHLTSPKGYDLVIVNVKVDNLNFVECYVGVDKTHEYFSNFKYTEIRDSRFKNVQKFAFEKYGSTKYLEHASEIAKMAPLDGAWLSFTSIGDPKIESFEFLREDFFYYGAAFRIRPGHQYCTAAGCYEAARLQLDRIVTYLQSPKPIIQARDYDMKELKEIISKSEMCDKKFWYYDHINESIVELALNDLMIVPYKFDETLNAKVWQLSNSKYVKSNSKYFIYASTGKIHINSDEFEETLYSLFESKDDLLTKMKDEGLDDILLKIQKGETATSEEGITVVDKVANPDGLDKLREMYLGKTVQIYPGDTHSKFGEVIDISSAGVIFKITSADSRSSTYVEGSTHFIAFSLNLNFRIING